MLRSRTADRTRSRTVGRVVRPGSDDGFSLVELSVAMMVLGVCAVAAAGMTLSMIKVATRTTAVADASTHLRGAFDEVGRALPSASQVNAPTLVGGDWYIEALFPPTSASVTSRCSQWRLAAATNQLQVRTWDTVNAVPSAWRLLAGGVVNDPTTQPPFTVIDPDVAFGSYRVSFRLRARAVDVGTVDQRVDFALRNSGVHTGVGPVCTQVGRP